MGKNGNGVACEPLKQPTPVPEMADFVVLQSTYCSYVNVWPFFSMPIYQKDVLQLRDMHILLTCAKKMFKYRIFAIKRAFPIVNEVGGVNWHCVIRSQMVFSDKFCHFLIFLYKTMLLNTELEGLDALKCALIAVFVRNPP